VHLGGDASWPIWIVSPDREERCVELNPGDAMIYLGKIAEHWRNLYEGNEYVQVFLHYVRSRGDCGYSYFDKSNTQKESELPTKTNEEMITMTVNSASKLENFIQVFDDILSDDECNSILSEYVDSNHWQNAITREGLHRDTRNCMEIPISSDYIINENFNVRKNLDYLVFKGVEKCIKKYTSIFKSFNIDVDTGYQILRYDEGGFYSQHTDSFKEQQRSLSCSIQLNDDYDGGCFSFFDGELSYKLNKGSAILFPSNFMYPHEITPITGGTRYSVITWLV
jgi:Rps23 Pro-64 3,4-dihydroxylase Tpa1-like proline 4-hydroxylase